MNGNLFQQYQTHVLGYSEIVYYDQIILNSRYREAVKREPMVGVKVLMKDTRAYNAPSPVARIQYINSGLAQVLNQTGCFLRESKSTIMPDGFWLVAFPVPRSQLGAQINQIKNTMINLGNYLGIVCAGLVEINVSGRATQFEFMDRISRIDIPEKYMRNLVKPDSGSGFISYNFGSIIPINTYYQLIKTRWTLDPTSLQYDGLKDIIENVSLRLSSVFY